MRPLALSAAGLLLFCACGGAPGSERPSPLLIVGVDGLEPAIVSSLLRQGRLPNVARFAEEGVLGRLATLEPTYSPVIWTTVATGQPMEVHGIDDFLEEETGLPYTSNCRRVPALWDLVSQHELRVDLAGWWVSWPAEAVRGRVLASYAAQAQAKIVWKPTVWRELPELTWPPELAKELAPIIDAVGDFEALTDDFWSAFEQRRSPPYSEPVRRCFQDLKWTFAADRAVADVAEWMLTQGPSADLTMVYLSAPDVAGHRFWRYHQPEDFQYEVAPEDARDFGEVLHESYEEIDRRLGRLLALAPPEANVILLSDHGMHADPTALTAEWADAIGSGHHQQQPPGVFAALGPDVRNAGDQLGQDERSILGHVLGVAPLALRLLRLPVPENWPVRLMGNPLEGRVLSDDFLSTEVFEWGPSCDEGFRAATHAREPKPGMNLEFMGVLSGLGYLPGEDE